MMDNNPLVPAIPRKNKGKSKASPEQMAEMEKEDEEYRRRRQAEVETGSREKEEECLKTGIQHLLSIVGAGPCIHIVRSAFDAWRNGSLIVELLWVGLAHAYANPDWEINDLLQFITESQGTNGRVSNDHSPDAQLAQALSTSETALQTLFFGGPTGEKGMVIGD